MKRGLHNGQIFRNLHADVGTSAANGIDEKYNERHRGRYGLLESMHRAALACPEDPWIATFRLTFGAVVFRDQCTLCGIHSSSELFKACKVSDYSDVGLVLGKECNR